jgi:NAD(P)-dependent dehydrogenase (short-subunit alcohol dehydrogenase family)
VSGLDGRVALVTGAARRRGIGRGIARRLAAAGCHVAVNDVAAEAEGRELVDELRSGGTRAGLFLADVSDRAAVDRLFDEVERELGPVDLVCSNAGIAAWADFDAIADADFDRVVAVNLTGAFNVGQEGARRLVTRGAPGRIVFTSSVHAQMPFAQMAIYGATKQALRALSDTMAVELGPTGITVNHVGPGWVKSFLNDASPSLRTEEDEAATIAMIPARRPAEPEEMGDAVVYLCSDEAAYVTGEYLRVDGGLVVGKY